MANVLRIAIGLAVLTLGRRLYWLFVGGAGFALGMMLATRFMAAQPTWLVLVVALASGLVGALLATLLQRAAVALGGFAAAGYAALSLIHAAGRGEGWIAWFAFIAAGIIGGVLVLAAFDWALILLSALTGAALIVETTGLGPGLGALALVALTALGIVVQATWMLRRQRTQRTEA